MMNNSRIISLLFAGFIVFVACSRHLSGNQVDKDGYTLAWADEFNLT